MNKSNFIHVATFGAAIGLKGEIKVNLLTSTIDVFRSLDQYYNFDQSIKWSFESIVMRQEKCVALPSHCKNRDDAEELKNQKIFSFKENFPSVNPNEYLVSDLIGCDIIHKNGNSLGNVISVDNFGAGDLLETIYKNKDTKSFLFKAISSNNINRHIQTIHRPSIKLSIKYLLKKLT